ncbi:hypothetical protein CNYM01_01920 [Colletotrichum nymphaeae SA-01]|uniref:Uncharacterized protein n=1 Tax=Colletotrichum nymphaeae SA-01 TaxID=1460502 RepID=A0A135TT85_9PEZI|nr:hypothetical protein CNYM01_01920 [Colletotrichum nymphaeae SA-01]
MEQSLEPSSVYRVLGPTTTVTGIAAAADANVRSEKKAPLAQAYLPVQQSHVGRFGKGIDSERSRTTQKVEPGKLPVAPSFISLIRKVSFKLIPSLRNSKVTSSRWAYNIVSRRQFVDMSESTSGSR